MAKLPDLTIDVKLNVPHETARACFHILEMYCKDIRGDFKPGSVGCSDCAIRMNCPLLLNTGVEEERND